MVRFAENGQDEGRLVRIERLEAEGYRLSMILKPVLEGCETIRDSHRFVHVLATTA